MDRVKLQTEQKTDLSFLSKHRPGLLMAASMLLSIPIVGYILREVFRRRNTRVMQKQLKRYQTVSDEATFLESRPRYFGGAPKPCRHAVLFLHGFSSSPQEFDTLAPLLQSANICYFAPALTGYGLNDFRLLYQIRADDWRRDAAAGYEMLSSFADEVSVVGHSTGANLALYVASKYPVKHLILSAANLAPSLQDQKFKQLINSPILGAFFRLAVPVFVKPIRRRDPIRGDTLDPASAGIGFSYRALPMQSLRALWQLQDETPTQELCYQNMHYFYGIHDLSVNNQASIHKLIKAGNEFSVHAFTNSAHNILEDFDKQDVIKQMSEIIRSV